VSHRHVQQLTSIQTEFAAARAAIALLERDWEELVAAPEMRAVRFPHVRAAVRNLEATYIIRLFSEFEALLYDHLTVRYPGRRVPRAAEALVNRAALRERIPDPVRDRAQAVREYRNTIVHRRTAAGSTLSFRDAMAALNQYLARLPNPP
jgi:hypothetical protein